MRREIEVIFVLVSFGILWVVVGLNAAYNIGIPRGLLFMLFGAAFLMIYVGESLGKTKRRKRHNKT